MKISRKFKSCTAVMVSAAVLSFAPCCVNAAEFADVEGHWAGEVIEKWVGKGIIKGYDGCFYPDAPIIRGDLAVIINRIFPSDDVAELENVFSDLDSEAYYADSILRLNKKGIMLGSDGKVYPEDNITREEAFVMLSRAFEISGNATEINFEDASEISDWARDIISVMCQRGIVNGSSDNKIHPKESITRAEVVQLLENINSVIGKSDEEGNFEINSSGTSSGTTGSSGSNGGSHRPGGSSKPNGGSGSSGGTTEPDNPESTGGLNGADVSEIDENIVEAGPISW